MAKRIVSVIVAALALSATSCDRHRTTAVDKISSADRTLLFKEVRNDKMSWDGDIGGLVPEPSDSFTKALDLHGIEWVPLLLELLDDPQRYAAAHVALITLTTDFQARNAERWNGLRVDLAADGAVTYDQNDMPALKKRWLRQLGRQ